MPLDPAWTGARRLLCLRLDNLGDVLMTTPAIRALKESIPGVQLTLLTSPSGAALGPLLPDIDGLIEYEAPWVKATPPRRDSRPEFGMAAQLQQAGFDAAVIFTVFSQNPLPAAFLTYLAGIPLRLAYCRENPYQLLTHWAPEPDREGEIRHEVQRQLDLVGTIGARTVDDRLSLRLPAGALRRARARLLELGLDCERPWALIHPGATAPSRRYPPESFARAAACLAQEGVQLVFSGGASERELVEAIRAAGGCPSFSLAGALELAEFAALVSLAPVLVANNSGPAHIAAAVGTPVVDLYALTNPQHTPWRVPQRVLSYDVPCKNCYRSVCPLGHHDCLRRVAPEQVAQAALELLGEQGAARLTLVSRGREPA